MTIYSPADCTDVLTCMNDTNITKYLNFIPRKIQWRLKDVFLSIIIYWITEYINTLLILFKTT